MSYVIVKPPFANSNPNFSYSDCPYTKYFLITTDREKFTDRQEACLADFSRSLDLILRGEMFGIVDDFDYFDGDCCVVHMLTAKKNASKNALLVFDVLQHAYGIDRASGFYIKSLTESQYMAMRFPDAEENCFDDDIPF